MKRMYDTQIKSDVPVVDPIIPSLGFVKGNVIVVSETASQLREQTTPEELFKILIKMGKRKELIENEQFRAWCFQSYSYPIEAILDEQTEDNEI